MKGFVIMKEESAVYRIKLVKGQIFYWRLTVQNVQDDYATRVIVDIARAARCIYERVP